MSREALTLDPGRAEAVRCLVEDHFGPGYWDGFQRYMVEEADTFHKEWRFGGQLGFGGKVHYNGRRCYVTCYAEDSDPLTDEEILEVNRQLEDVLR